MGGQTSGRWDTSCSRRWQIFCFVVLISVFAIYRLGFGGLSGQYQPTAFSAGTRHSRRAAAFLNSGDPKPPQAPIVFGKDTVQSLNATLQEAVANERNVVKKIIKDVKKPEDATFENTITPYMQQEQATMIAMASLLQYAYISPKKDLQKISEEAGTPLTQAAQETAQNKDFFARVDHVYQQQAKHPDPKLSAEDKLLLKQFWLSFADNGLHLPEDALEKLQNVSVQITDLTSDFGAAVTSDKTILWLTREEMNGTKPEVLDSLEKGEGEHKGKLKLDFQSPDLSQILQYTTNETIRRLIEYTSGQQAPSNEALIPKLIKLRDEQARLLNYSSYSDMVIRDETAKSPAVVEKMLCDIRDKMITKLPSENNRLKERKKLKTGKADHLWLWDSSFYSTDIFNTVYQLDADYLKEWFPADYMFEEMLKMYAQIYALKFIAITGKDLDMMSPTKNGSDLFWAPDVTLYAVWDDADDTKGEFIGYLYVDLYYREGKAPGAFMSPMTGGFTKPDGSRYYPTVGLFTNFKKTTSAKPQLIRRGSLATIFHEAGHTIHGLVSRTKYARFHGTSTPRDWVEMPSQLMENWSNVPAVLKRLSKHYSYLSPEAKKIWEQEQIAAKKPTTPPPEHFPDDLIQRVLESKKLFAAGNELYQTFNAAYDQLLHNPKSPADLAKIDPTELYNREFKKYQQLDGFEDLDPNVPENKAVGAGKGFHWGHRQTTFEHIFSGGYGGKYYGYTWSRINAKDVFYTKFQKDPFSRVEGSRWRKIVLEPGATKDYDQILQEYLGRKPNDKAFLKDLGVDV